MSESPDIETTAPQTTGNEAVDEALSALSGLADRPVTEHAPAYEQVHTVLRDVLNPPREPGDA